MFKYSVVIPAYNRGYIIDRAIQSILRQNYREPIEIIVVDDVSTDKTCENIEQRYKDMVSVIKLSEHLGRPGLVRHKGIERAGGQYISFCDSDDLWMSNHLQIVDEAIKKEPELEFVRTRSKFCFLTIDKDRFIENFDFYVHDVDVITTNSCVISKAGYLKLKGFGDLVFGEDQALWGQASANLKNLYIKEVTTIYNWMRDGDNLTWKFHPNVKFNRLKK